MFGMFKRMLSAPEPTISREESLNGIPMVNTNIESHEGPNGELLVMVPRKPFLGYWLSQYIKSDLPPAKILLDELGSSVWKMINGKRNVGEIVELFSKETELHHREAEAGVVEFINMLMKRGIVSIAFKDNKK